MRSVTKIRVRVPSAESELSNSGRKSGCKSGRKSVYFLNAVAVISGNKRYLSFYEVRVVLRNGWL